MSTPAAGGCTPTPVTPVSDFPPLVARAIARAAAADGGGLGELDGEERALLVRIVRNVSVAVPAGSVRIANATLAAALHASERTVRRLKSALEAKGWITRRQVQSRRHGMQVLDIWLTPHALATLFGPDGADPDRRRTGQADAWLAFQQSSRQPCGASTAPPSGAANTAQPSRDSGGPLPEDSSARPERDAAATATSSSPAADCLPADVRMLADVGGITVAGVRLLMGAATRAGTRLGDVLSAAGEAVLEARQPFGYIKKLIDCGRDWSSVARERRCQDAGRQRADQKSGELQRLLQTMGAGTMYSHEKRRFVWRAEYGHVCQSTVQDAAGGGIGRWLPVADVSGLATAWSGGRLFPVTTADLAAWGVSDAPARAGGSLGGPGSGRSAAAGPSETVIAALRELRGQLGSAAQI